MILTKDDVNKYEKGRFDSVNDRDSFIPTEDGDNLTTGRIPSLPNFRSRQHDLILFKKERTSL